MIDGLSTFAARGLEALLLWSWQVLALLTCVWLVLKVARFKSPAQRYQIWLFALIVLAALPPASLLVQRLPEIRPSHAALNFVIDGPQQVVKRVSASGTPLAVASKEPVRNLARKLVCPVLFACWLMGSLFVLGRLMASQIRLRSMCRRALPISTDELDLPCHNGQVRLLISDEVASPMLCGIFRPTIILPADIVEWSSALERQAMVQHELAHIERLDPLANLFQNALRTVLFFHPLFRYACNQLSLERELACDQHVLAGGTRAETYAEGLLKAAERGLKPNAGLAFLLTPQTLERRIEMIFRERMRAHNWKLMVLLGVTIAVIAWLLIPAGASVSGQAEPSVQSQAKIKIVKEMGERKALDELIDMALHDPDPELRRLAAVRLAELEGDGSTEAMVDLYHKTDDSQVKIMLIDTLARVSEIEPLVKIALSAQDVEEKQRVLRRIKFLKQHSESNDVRNFDVSSLGEELKQVQEEPPPPPPPPPGRRMPPAPPPKKTN
jgi:beta-lactamase regulating signal transducer with metallopeptidase domain